MNIDLTKLTIEEKAALVASLLPDIEIARQAAKAARTAEFEKYAAQINELKKKLAVAGLLPNLVIKTDEAGIISDIHIKGNGNGNGNGIHRSAVNVMLAAGWKVEGQGKRDGGKKVSYKNYVATSPDGKTVRTIPNGHVEEFAQSIGL